jgi:hypothetical protein
MVSKNNTIDSPIGEVLVQNGYMSVHAVDVVLMRQEFGDSRLFGQIATSLNFLSEDHLFEFLKS